MSSGIARSSRNLMGSPRRCSPGPPSKCSLSDNPSAGYVFLSFIAFLEIGAVNPYPLDFRDPSNPYPSRSAIREASVVAILAGAPFQMFASG